MDALIDNGEQLFHAIQAECAPEQFKAVVKQKLGNRANEFIKALPDFNSSYQLNRPGIARGRIV